MATLVNAGTNASASALSDAGLLYIAHFDADTIEQVTGAGVTSILSSAVVNPSSLQVDAANNRLIVFEETDGGRLVGVDLTTGAVSVFSPNNLTFNVGSAPQGILFDGSLLAQIKTNGTVSLVPFVLAP